eukprot:ANDGO_05387.mRNA.1 hypothetical protein
MDSLYRPTPPWERSAEVHIAQKKHVQAIPVYAGSGKDFLHGTAHPSGDPHMTGKFGRGFYRRNYAQIRQDEPRKQLEALNEQRKQEGFESHQRQLSELSSYNSWNLISGEYDAAKVPAPTGKKYIDYRISAAAEKRQAAYQGVKPLARERVNLVRCEGLTATRKNGSVADTLRHGYDGYPHARNAGLPGGSANKRPHTTGFPPIA